MATIGFLATESTQTLDRHAAAFRQAACAAVYAHVQALLDAVQEGDVVLIPSSREYPLDADDIVALLSGVAERGATVRHGDGTMDTATAGGRFVAEGLLAGAAAVIERRRNGRVT